MPASHFRRPHPIEIEPRPRPGSPPRLLARLSPRDARLWHDLGADVAQALEPRLRPGVVANRAVRVGGGWRLEDLEASFRRLRKGMRSLLAAPANRAVLATDVRDFFPSLTPGTVALALVDAGVPAEIASRAAAMLEGWASRGYHGLPIGPPASAVMANAVLRSVDDVVGATFLRWVDDYLVLVRDERHAAEVLERMDQALARVGLRRSVPKTNLGLSPCWLGSAVGGSARSGMPSA